MDRRGQHGLGCSVEGGAVGGRWLATSPRDVTDGDSSRDIAWAWHRGRASSSCGIASLAAAGASTTSSALRFFSFDGAYTESLTMEQAIRDDVLVATSMFGEPVTREHGGPVRLYVAPMYGYKSLKWMSGIEVVDEVVPGYWEVRGYDIDAWVGASNGRDDEPIA